MSVNQDELKKLMDGSWSWSSGGVKAELTETDKDELALQVIGSLGATIENGVAVLGKKEGSE